MAEVQLLVRGMIYENWSTASVTKSLDALFGEAQLSLTRRFAEGPQAIPQVRIGDDIRLVLDGQPVIAGYVKSRDLQIDASGFDFSVTVRDRAGLLATGSVLNSPAEWKNQTALQIITDVCQPFGVAVRADVPVGDAFENFTARPGEKAGELIERVCRHRALLCRADALGQLILTTAMAATPMQAPIVLEYGQSNALGLSLSEDIEERHHHYICMTQRQEDGASEEDNTQIMGEARDPGMPLYSPLVVVADEPGTSASMAKLATTMAAVNAARSISRDYMLPGWTNAAGEFWETNRTVLVRDKLEGFEGTRLIQRATLSLSASGAPMVQLTLIDPVAYTLIAEPEVETGGVA